MPDQVVTYDLVVSNNSWDIIKYTRINFPFDPKLQTLLDVRFSDKRGWVSGLLTNSVTMQIETLPYDEQITATLRLRISPDAPLDTVLASQAIVPWDAAIPGATLRSNRVDLRIADQPDDSDIVPLTLRRGPPGSTTVSAAYDGFAPLEYVSLWYERPDGVSIALAETTADAQGRVTALFDLGKPAPGWYQLVAYGQCSQVTAAEWFNFDPAATREAPAAPTDATAEPAAPTDEAEEGM